MRCNQSIASKVVCLKLMIQILAGFETEWSFIYIPGCTDSEHDDESSMSNLNYTHRYKL